jgi:hypothetical protein
MRVNRLINIFLAVTAFGSAAVVDRAALVVGKSVFTESEVENEARLTQFESGKPLDLSAAQRKQAAERLADQELLRQEMAASAFQTPSTDSNTLVQSFRRRRFSSLAQYQAALTRYGVTEGALKQRLLWETELIHFTDQRFKPFAPPSSEHTANRSETDGATAEDTVDQLMDAWLKQQRANTRIVFIAGAFQ